MSAKKYRRTGVRCYDPTTRVHTVWEGALVTSRWADDAVVFRVYSIGSYSDPNKEHASRDHGHVVRVRSTNTGNHFTRFASELQLVEEVAA